MNNKQRQGLLEICKALFLIVILCLAAYFLSSCSKEDDPAVIRQVLLVYLGGDNSLSGEVDQKLHAIAEGFSGGADRCILVYQDQSGEVPCLFEISGKNKLEQLAVYDEENSADAKVFNRFLREAAVKYPGASFNLLVFSHASGWMPEGSFRNPSTRSIVEDRGHEMDLQDFASAIPDGMFQSIVFEACHMAGIEVAYELKDKARYIIGSSAEIVSPGFTQVYVSSIDELVGGNPQKFIEKAYSWFANQAGYLNSATFSLIETDKLTALAAFVKDNCDFTQEVTIDDIQHFDRGSGYLFCDLEDYYKRLLSTDDQQRQLQQLIRDCVSWKAATPFFMEGYKGFQILEHSGLTGYIPQDRYWNLNTAYKQLAWSRAFSNDE